MHIIISIYHYNIALRSGFVWTRAVEDLSGVNAGSVSQLCGPIQDYGNGVGLCLRNLSINQEALAILANVIKHLLGGCFVRAELGA